jgi:hypothetical protein
MRLPPSAASVTEQPAWSIACGPPGVRPCRGCLRAAPVTIVSPTRVPRLDSTMRAACYALGVVVSSMLSFKALRTSCRFSWWLAVTLSCACSSDPPGTSCGVTGRERSCPCNGNAVGIQACQFDGQWEACTCYPRAGNTVAGSAGVVAANGGSGGASADAGRGGATGQRASADRAAAGGSASPWNPWDGFPGFAGFPWSR